MLTHWSIGRWSGRRGSDRSSVQRRQQQEKEEKVEGEGEEGKEGKGRQEEKEEQKGVKGFSSSSTLLNQETTERIIYFSSTMILIWIMSLLHWNVLLWNLHYKNTSDFNPVNKKQSRLRSQCVKLSPDFKDLGNLSHHLEVILCLCYNNTLALVIWVFY